MTETTLGLDTWGWPLIDLAWKSAALLLAAVGIERFFLRSRPLAADAVWFTTLLVLMLLPLISFLTPTKFGWQLGLVSAEQVAEAKPMATRASERGSSSSRQPERAEQQSRGTRSGANDSVRDRSVPHFSMNTALALAEVVYLAVAMLLAIRLAGGYLLARRFSRESEIFDAAAWTSRLAPLRHKLGIRRQVSLGLSDKVLVPATLGWHHPVILLPPDLGLVTDRATIDAILLHELTHIVRRDYAAQIGWRVCQCLYWWNPLVWHAARRAAETREVISDGYCVATLGAREAYVGLLLDTANRLVARRVTPLAVAMARTPQLKRRLELLYALHVAAPLARKHHRFVVIAIGAALLVVAGVVHGVAPAAPPASEKDSVDRSTDAAVDRSDEPATDDIQDPFAAPELLYLAWQKGGWKSTGDKTPHDVWDPSGNLLSKEQSAAALKEAKTFAIHWRHKEELIPLSLAFKVDERLTSGPIMPTVITVDGIRHMGGTGLVPVKGIAVCAVAPRKNSLAQWPKQISLEFRYALENPQVIRELTEVPDEPVQLGDGATWYLDANRALEEQNERMVRVPHKTAAVLQWEREPDGEPQPLVSYGAHVFLKDGKELPGGYVTVIGPKNAMHVIEVSTPFDGEADIARIEFTRQRFRLAVIKNVPLRLEDLPEQPAP